MDQQAFKPKAVKSSSFNLPIQQDFNTININDDYYSSEQVRVYSYQHGDFEDHADIGKAKDS